MADSAGTVDVLSALPFKSYEDDKEKQPERWARWVHAVSRKGPGNKKWEPRGKYVYLCSEHFITDWVKNAWDKDFTDIDPLSLELENDLSENDYHIEKLHKVCETFDEWIIEKEASSGEGFWTVLVENDLSYKSFTAFLAYLMEVGHRRVASCQQRQAGLLAASNYFKLVTIPGSGAFKLFHPMLFQRGMDMLKSWTSLGTGNRKREASISSSQLGSKAGRRKRARTTGTVTNFSDDEDEEDNAFTAAEINHIKKAILCLLKDFIQLLDNFSLNQSDSSSHYAVSVLCELTNVDPELFDGDFNRSSLNAMPVSALAYKGLQKLLSPAHGELSALTTSVFKHILPRILMFIGDNKGVAAQAIPRSVLLTKDHAVQFVCYLIKDCDESVLSVVRILLQHMCAKVPDKAEYRTNVAQSIITILKRLNVKHYVAMMEWIAKFSRNGKNSYRAFSIDLINLIIKEPERQPSEDIPEEKLTFLQHKFLLEIILARCSDLGPTVRARAIQAFTQCLASASPEVVGAFKDIVTPKPSDPNEAQRPVPTPEIERTRKLTDTTPQSEETVTNTPEQLSADTPVISAPTPAAGKRDTPVVVNLNTPENVICLQDTQGVISMLRRRAADEKVMVRKAALQALENIVRLEGPAYRVQDVDVLKDRCRDPALSVRKQAMQSLTDLLHLRPQDKQLQSAWLDGVLPLVMDRETSAQERCLETLEELILRNIVPLHRTNPGEFGLVWDLLDIMAGDGGAELRRFLQKACQHWSREGKIKPAMINSLQTHVNHENDAGAWLLLAEIAPSCPKFKHDFVLDYWKKTARVCQASQYSTCQRVLTVLGCIAKHLSQADRTELIDDLKAKLLAFNFPPELVAATVTALSKLCDTEGDSFSQKEQWCTELLIACDKFLSKLILNDSQDDITDEDKVVRHLFTLGEIAQLCPANTPKRVFMLVQSLIAAPCLSTEDSSTCSPESLERRTAENDKPSSQSSEGSPEAIVQSQASRESQGSQKSQAPFSQTTQVLSQFRGSKMPAKIRTHAFVTLGKLCLQNEDVAKKCVSALARELEISPDYATRNNVVVILCDLCVRYTTLVDRYVVNIAACLKDDSALVRKQTLTLLTRLLQEDFLKWKGVLFYRFVTSLLDDNKDISVFAEFCLVNILLQRNRNMFFHHFVECVFHFNGYEKHSVYNKFQQTDREKQMFSLKGSMHLSKRHRLYRFMLEHMDDGQRFDLTAKLSHDILGGVVDDVIPLTSESSQLLDDALSILCCKEIKLSYLKAKPNDDIMDEQDMAAVVMATAKKTFITQVVKRNFMENIVPIVTSLKHLLEQHRSPVLRSLMLYLRELMKDYKNEVQEILATDRQLATEIEYDLRKFEEQEKNPSGDVPVGSPRSISSPRVGAGSKPGSPFSGGTTPKTPSGSSRTSPQTGAINTPKSGGPGLTRHMSLSTVAILNSAKRAMVKVKTAQEARNSPNTPKGSPCSADKGNAQEDTSKSEDPNSDENEAKGAPIAALFKTPNNMKRNKRAISTPAGVLGNITFHPDQNMSALPPSPITGSSSELSQCLTPKAGRPQHTEEDIVYMCSPDQPVPKPRTWNVTATPPSRSGKSRLNGAENKADDQEKNKDLETSPRRLRSSRRRTSRLSRLQDS